MADQLSTLLDDLVERFSEFSQVEAIALGGSRAAGTADPTSDIDLYVFTSVDIPADERLAAAREFSPDAHLNDFWGPGAEWLDPKSGIHCDIVFFNTDWMWGQVERNVIHALGGTGYSTCFWHTAKLSEPLFDRSGWLADLKALADQPYPEALVTSILNANYPILRRNESAYYFQLKKAVDRGDIVSINHRVAEFLSSYFDIIYAANRLPHPGEKCLIETTSRVCGDLPQHFEDDIRIFIESIAAQDDAIMGHFNRILDRLDELLAALGLNPD